MATAPARPMAGSAGEVHDRALKAAETDATKRALATFGKAFGLALYAGGNLARSKSSGPCPAQRLESRRSDRGSRCSLGDAARKRPAAIAPPQPPASPGGSPRSEVRNRPSRPGHHQRAVLRRRIDKSALALPEPRRVRDKDHLRYVASQPCLLCSATPSDAHHVRFAQPRAMGRKVGDEFTVPLCRAHHRELHHSGNEAAWWHDMGIDPIEIAQQLWSETENRQSQKAEYEPAL